MSRPLAEVPCIDPLISDQNLVDRLTHKGWKHAYGLLWRPSWAGVPFTQLDVEKWAYLLRWQEAKGGLGAAGHFRNYVDIKWGSNKLGAGRFVWHPWALEMLDAACSTSFLGLAGSSGSGKSDFMAMWGVANWDMTPQDTKVIIITTTLKDAKGRIWGAIERYFHAGGPMPGKLLSSFGLIRLQTDTIKPDAQRGLELFSADQKSFTPEDGSKIKGFHAPRIIVLFDEMTDLAKASIEAAANLMSNPWCHFIGSGNPSSYFNAFGEWCEPREGWNSISENDSNWRTKKGGICLRFDSRKNINVTSGKTIYPFLHTIERIQQIALVSGGINSPSFRSMVAAQFTAESADNCLYSESDIVTSGSMDKAVFIGDTVKVASLDPSFSVGGDGCPLAFGQLGRGKNGVKIMELTKIIMLNEDVTNKAVPRTQQICNQIAVLCKKEGVTPQNLAIDATGAGAPFCDALAVTEGWNNSFLRVMFGGGASLKPISPVDKTPAKDKYSNRVSELWHVAKSFIRNGQIKGITADVGGQMTARKLDKRTGDRDKIRVESKDDMKARCNKSPDKADALMIMLELCRTRLGMNSGEKEGRVEGARKGDWRRKMERYQV